MGAMAPATPRYGFLVLVGLSDLVIGLVLAGVGWAQDNGTLTLVGVALACLLQLMLLP